ncbi:PREDICTED: peroxisome assembly protein 12 [Ceratosolen solmsi marchali]|uniref:Peroxisome assembly protein 12 n=1 Tax=Ceratosolen solmsi marchali TaxID=326594 RepID=A0AAJ6YNQ7_9HYME|nr:PREDICTED: peroxisome assembly protein 12 [Ceratosolen solmsi marchali]
MAERGAHLTGTTFAKPSIFEIAAHKSLAKILEPAAKRIITFLASIDPEKYAWLHQWSNEIYLISITVLQNYYLNNYSASFSETFYGLKRIALTDSKGTAKLSNKQLKLSLIILVVLPYFQRKIEDLKNENTNLDKKWKYFIRMYNILYVIKEIFSFRQYLLYLSNKSIYPTLSLRLLKINLTFANSSKETGLIELLRLLGQGNINANSALEILRLTIVRSIEASAFFLQFLRWWNQENYADFNLLRLPVPPPPQIPESVKIYKGICPICRRKPWIHTALSVSGFVYCYQCILLEIRKNKKCPVTNYPAKEDDLIRLYMH